MKTSQDRILTTHVGSLPRPDELADMLLDREHGKAIDAETFATAAARAVKDIVQRQIEIGIDVISDGEMAKVGYSTYIKDRCTGFSGDSPRRPPADLARFPSYMERQSKTGEAPTITRPVCTGDIAVKDRAPLRTDIDNFQAALVATPALDAFLNASSPGVISAFLPNEHYATEDDYLEALGVVMREEFEEITQAGFVLQIDCPDLAMARHTQYKDVDDDTFVRDAGRRVAVLNAALENVPAEQVRMHICWGNYEGPHDYDIPLAKIAAELMRAKPQGISFEAANPRHAHEWTVWRDIDLPDDKILLPGVIDTCTNYIEHPDLVAERICRFADIVGRERVIGSTDCGFSTFTRYGHVVPEIAFEKLRVLVEGASIASQRLW